MGWVWLDVGHTWFKLNGTASIQHSDSESSFIQWVFQFCLSRPKQLLLLFMHHNVWWVLRSESYGATLIQRSDSEGTLTQLATTCRWFESNGTSTQCSDSGLPLTLNVGLESDFWPGRPAEPGTVFSNQVRLIAIGGLDQRTFSWSDLFGIIQFRTVWLSLTESLTPLSFVSLLLYVRLIFVGLL